VTLTVPGRGLRFFRFTAEWITETGQVCVCLDDVTEQRALEQRMKQREKQLLFETLVAGIAHELNNKLTPVLGFAELLGGCTDPATRQSYTTCIGKSVLEAATIIRQLLQLSRPENTCLQTVDLREVRPELAGRFVFVTGHAGEEDWETDLSSWHVPVVRKPFSLARLADVCQPFLTGPLAA
jgi:signal transduction histidine kinase